MIKFRKFLFRGNEVENNKQQEHVTKQIICNALLVEDDEICRKLLENQLIQLGYQVEIAKNARTAIQFLNSTFYNLVLTDLGLPDQPGEAVIQAARKCEFNQSTPLIVCTAHADGKVEQECLVLGADQVLIKPILAKNLQQAIDECLLMPGYRRKYKFQLKVLKKQVELFLQQEKKSFISEIEEREISRQLRSIAQRFVKIVDEYLQWPLTTADIFHENNISFSLAAKESAKKYIS